jgi:HK97 family phage portal protein
MSNFNWLDWTSQWVGRRFNLRDGKVFSSFFGGSNFASEPMTADIAMQLSAVWKCIRLNASTIGSLPFGLVAADGSGKEDRNSTLDIVLRTSPNARQSSMTFWEAIIGCQELLGNGFAHKRFNGAKEVSALDLLNPGGMELKRNSEGNDFRWLYTDTDGHRHELSRDEVFHLNQFSFDGELGLSTVRYGAQTLGSARAADRVTGQMFASGLSASGFLKTNQILQAKDRHDFQKIMDDYRGRSGVGKLMILEAGMDFSPVSMSAQDAQLLTSRKFNIEEVCRWYDVPPVLAGHNPEGGTSWGSGVEQVFLFWLQLGLRTRLRRIEGLVAKQLLTPEQRRVWTPKYNIDALLQGDSAARGSLFSNYLQNGVMNPNEVRALLNLPPYKGGELYLRQVNLAPADTLGENPVTAESIRSTVQAWLGVKNAA